MGIVGNNGTGKSTFIKMLLGQVAPDSGRFDIGDTVRFGYFSQEGLKFDDQQKVIDVIKDIAEYIDLGSGRHMTAAQFLQYFMFTPHDRYFMDKVVDHLLVFKGEGEIKDFPGNYTQYREWQKLQTKEEAEKAPKAEAKVAKKPTNSNNTTERKKLSFKEKREFEQLEKDIEQLETEKKAIEEALSSGTISVDEITEKSIRLPKLQDELDEKTMRWLELSERA